MRLRQIEASNRPLWFWTPLGRYVCNLGETLLEHLAALQDLPSGHVLLQAGLLGGTPASAADAARAIRQCLDTCRRHHTADPAGGFAPLGQISPSGGFQSSALGGVPRGSAPEWNF